MYGRYESWQSLIDYVLHARVANREIEVWLTNEDKALAQSLVGGISKPLYALCMGGTRAGNHYPPENYARLVEMILDEEPTATVAILGGGEIDKVSLEIFKKALAEKFYGRILNFINRLTYRQSAAILKFCDMYIGNDTGTMHLAAAVKCSVLSVICFPANLPLTYKDTPKIYGPYNVPNVLVMPKQALIGCDHPEPSNNHGCIAPMPHCITQIKPETIFKGFHLLKERIAKNLIEPLYIY